MAVTSEYSHDRKHFVLPDFILACPFTYMFNPSDKSIAADSLAWIYPYVQETFGDTKRNAFPSTHFQEISYHTFPYAEAERLRTCCDFLNLLFYLDEVSDEMVGTDAYAFGAKFVRAMTDGDDERGDGSAMWRAAKDFRRRFWKNASIEGQQRFIQAITSYTDGFAREASLRERRHVLNIDDFVKLRREDSGVRTAFSLIESAVGIDIPDDVFRDPIFQRLCDGAVDMICWSNDVYSYKMEAASGLEGNNVVTVLMKMHGMTLQEAIDEAAEHFKVLVRQYLELKSQLPGWGSSANSAATQYFAGLECWVVGNLHWSLSTARYFGATLEEVKRTHIVHI